jgi:hypothetical protein
MENIKDSPPILSGPFLIDEVKTCRKCGASFPATVDHFYRNSGGKFGLTPRCKSCVDEDNKASHAARLLRDPDKIRVQANARSKAYYQRNLDECRKKGREAAKSRHATDPGLKRRARLKSNYGMTPEQWREMFEAQGCKCAICGSDKPNAKAGWNTDHCHKSGRVRFILCAHCNRGLGAFRDNPDWMRKAADMLEAING